MAASRSSRYSGSDSTSEFLMQVELSVLDTTIVMVFADMGPPDGPVIICIHGSPATYRAYHTMFQPLTEAGMRLVIPNFPGMGYTNVDDKENFNFSPQHKAEVVKALIQKLKLERVEMIIGHSMGGHLAALVAATDNNNIIKSVCFLAGPGVTPHYYPFNST
ncbi:haloalkane dehalogenase-like [Saccoglossus kowalevskii]|uniref:Uncharacterized protein LOC100366407 n=1 Tax=Saccoglossus kowalevskii TaxID=10224 RepID=A0ABM0ME55_SACKO|nr:PREDICTED: uncharacterized protein LOC100366407 [Saccoglossus kowalevskii]